MTTGRIPPPAPRCFDTRDVWVEFIASADACKDGERAPKPWLSNGQWNPEFHPCTDCLSEFETAMVAAHRCQRGAFSWTPPRVQASLLETA